MFSNGVLFFDDTFETFFSKEITVLYFSIIVLFCLLIIFKS